MSTASMRALARANEHRCGKAAVKAEIKAGQRTIAEVIAEVPFCCAKTPVFDALQWVPRVGRTKALKLTRSLVSETLPLCHVGPSTRAQLLERLAADPVTGVRR